MAIGNYYTWLKRVAPAAAEQWLGTYGFKTIDYMKAAYSDDANFVQE